MKLGVSRNVLNVRVIGLETSYPQNCGRKFVTKMFLIQRYNMCEMLMLAGRKWNPQKTQSKFLVPDLVRVKCEILGSVSVNMSSVYASQIN